MQDYDEALPEGLPGPEERMAAYRQLLNVDPDFEKEKYRSTPPTWPELWDMVECGIQWSQMCAADWVEEKLWIRDHCDDPTLEDGEYEIRLEEAKQAEEAEFDMWGALEDLKKAWPAEPPGRYGDAAREDDGFPF